MLLESHGQIGSYNTSDCTFIFKKKETSILVDYYFFDQHQGTYSLENHAFHVLSQTDLPSSLDEKIIKLLNQGYIPSIREGCLTWKPPQLVEPIQQFLRLAEEQVRNRKFDEAVTSLLESQRLASQVADPLGEAHFLEKLDRQWLEELYNATHASRVEFLLLQKDAIRIAFEMRLDELSKAAPVQKKPTCFICFSIEADVGRWLEQTFVPDLDRIGIAPLFCFRDLGPGKDLNEFQELIRFSDLAIIICTDDLKRKYTERIEAPTGVAQEIRLAKERYKDPTKHETIYPVYLKGGHDTVCPSPIFEPILGTNLTCFDRSTSAELFTYYSAAFELFGAMRKLARESSRQIKKAFLKDTQAILCDKKINREAITQWRLGRENHHRAVRTSVTEIVKKALKEPLIQRACFSLNVPHPSFVGRESLLDRLNQAFKFNEWRPSIPTKRQILFGPGGIGKTELAIKFVNDHLSIFSLVWFIHTESSESYEKDYRNLAHALNLETDKDTMEEVRKKVHSALEYRVYNTQKPWMIIYDNAEFIIETPKRGGYVIVTSQYPRTWDQNELIEVTPFTFQETEQLFKPIQSQINGNGLQTLVDKVEGIPLLLEQVAHDLERTGRPLQEYLQEVDVVDDVLWNEDSEKRYPKILANVFKKNLEDLKQINSDAYEFLTCAAFLNTDCISMELLEFWCIQNKKITGAKVKVREALNKISMIRFQPIQGTFAIHRLLQAVMRHLNKNQEENAYLSTVNMLFSWSHKFVHENLRTWKIGEECAQHLETLKMHPAWSKVDKREKENLLFAVGTWHSKVQGDFKRAIEFLYQSWGLILEYGDNANIALRGSELGLCYNEFEETKKGAQQYFLISLDLRLREYGEVHPQTAESYHQLSLVEEPGSQEQLDYCRKALNIWQQIHSNQSPRDIALGHYHLAKCLFNRREYPQAYYHIQEAIRIYKACYQNTHHPELAEAYDQFGIISLHMPIEETSAFQTAAQIREVIFGKNHRKVIQSCRVLTKAFKEARKFDSAFKESNKALDIACNLYGITSPEVASIYMDRAEIFFEMGKDENIEKSLALKQFALTIWSTLSQEGCYDLAMIYSSIGTTLFTLRRSQEALSYEQTAVTMLEAVLGPLHKETIRAKCNFAFRLKELNMHSEAIPYCIGALSYMITNFKKFISSQKVTEEVDAVNISIGKVFFDGIFTALKNHANRNDALTMANELLLFCQEKRGPNSAFVIKLAPLILGLTFSVN